MDTGKGPRARIITHIHTDASNAEASQLDERITGAIKLIDGEDSPITWTECFTPVSRLEELLRRGRGRHGEVHMIMVTDHMRACSHRLRNGHLRASARDHRLALGAELATRTLDHDGVYRPGPEILAYGGPDLVEGPEGPHYGLSQELLDELYGACMDREGKELCTRRARDFLEERGIAHGLSHPFDGHFLSFEGMFKIISEFPFVETVNGGYFAESARVLDAFVRLNNAIIRGASLPEEELSPLARRIVDHIRRHGRIITPWSGSDAHSHDFDRVVISMEPPGGRSPGSMRPGELFEAMVAHARTGRGEDSPFQTHGKAGTFWGQLLDVSVILMRNLAHSARQISHPVTGARILSNALTITNDELRERREWQRDREIQLRRDFNPMRLLGSLSWEASPRPGRTPSRASRPARRRGEYGLDLRTAP